MKNKTDIPWLLSDEWNQAIDSIRYVTGVNKARFIPLARMAAQINNSIKSLSDPIEKICKVTCVSCQDICCRHATIWYDLKDLLCLHLAAVPLPDSQIRKVLFDNKPACSRFSEHGCKLPREHRPFVCTWYFCPVQTQFLDLKEPHLKKKIEKTLLDIKTLRNEIELQFVCITG